MVMGDWNHFSIGGGLIIWLFAVSRSRFPSVSYEMSKPWRLSDWIAGTYHLFPPIVQKSMSVRFQICQCHSELWSIIYHAQGFLEQSHLDSLPSRPSFVILSFLQLYILDPSFFAYMHLGILACGCIQRSVDLITWVPPNLIPSSLFLLAVHIVARIDIISTSLWTQAHFRWQRSRVVKSLSAHIGRVRILSFLFLVHSKLDVLTDNKSVVPRLLTCWGRGSSRRLGKGFSTSTHALGSTFATGWDHNDLYLFIHSFCLCPYIFSDTRRSHHRYLSNCWM